MSGPARRIAPPPWLDRAAVRQVYDAVGDGRFVGGAVRDLLLGRRIGDLDLATPSPPDRVTARLDRGGIRWIPTGLAHGTVTALAGKEPIEITTLRRDVETDGRHAIVAFTDDWAADAARRDLTMNALYLDASGDLWDPVSGIEDCFAGRVRFVGEPTQRIQEDYLRLLRFYRFQALYGRTEPDPAARIACRNLADQLGRLAGERIQAEVLKLLAAPDPVPTVRLMGEDLVLDQLFGTHGTSVARLAALVPLEPAPDPIRRLAALLRPHAAGPTAERLKLSARDRDRLLTLSSDRPRLDLSADVPAQREMLYRIGAPLYCDRVLLQATDEGDADQIPRLVALADGWSQPVLPVSGSDILALGMQPGPLIGALLQAVETWWIAGEFRADRAACLARLRQLTAGGPQVTTPIT